MLFLRFLFKNRRIVEWLRLKSHLDSGGHLVKLYHLNRETCPELCPGGFWIFPGPEIPSLLWMTCDKSPSVKSCFLMFRWALLCFSLCPLSLVLWLDTALKNLSLSLQFVSMNKSPWAFSLSYCCLLFSVASLQYIHISCTGGVQSWCGITRAVQMWRKWCKLMSAS